MTGIPVSFSDEEIEDMWRLATNRQGLKERYGVPTKRAATKLSETELHYLGIKGERAVASLIGEKINREHTPHGDGGADLVYRGLSIDAKFSQLDIKMYVDDSPKADILILVQPLRRTMNVGPYQADALPDPYVKFPALAWKNALVVGWITRKDFVDRHVVRQIGGFDRKVFYAHNMRNMRTLLTYALSVGDL